ncbi:MAG TPA: RHS repeat-associated core domain-containing protein, partial [Chitinophagaceae bacterium]|nr:RHS repeat-associated core domain-containing protein [Chitinophagaceae bacterium]
GNKTLERETLQVMDDRRRIAMVDTRTAGDDGTPLQLIRFQLDDHSGSACLELDEQARIISYEEYHPFGTTAYQATDASRQVPAKRYRYTGMERDEESGFNYHSARYYAPWLARWLSADPLGIEDGANLYAYARNNPLVLSDKAGTLSKENNKFIDDAKKHLDQRVKDVEASIKKKTAAVDAQIAKDRKFLEGKFGKEFDRVAKKDAKVKKLGKKKFVEQKIAERRTAELKARKIPDLQSQVKKLKDLKDFYSTHKFTDQSLILANVVWNEAGSQPQDSKVAVAYAWINRAGKVRDPTGAEVSDYKKIEIACGASVHNLKKTPSWQI